MACIHIVCAERYLIYFFVYLLGHSIDGCLDNEHWDDGRRSHPWSLYIKKVVVRSGEVGSHNPSTVLMSGERATIIATGKNGISVFAQ